MTFQDGLKGRVIPKLRRAIEIVKILIEDMARADIFKHASAMAYVTLFSLVPSLAAVFALVSLFKPILGADSILFNRAKTYILENLATGAGEQLIRFLDEFISNLDMTKIGLTGFAGLMFTLILLIRQVEIALNNIWLVKRPRHVLVRFVYFWTFLTLGTLIIGLSVGIVSGFNLQRLNPFNQETLTVGQEIMQVVAPFCATFLSFLLLYKIVPNTYVRLRHAAMGALIAAIMFGIAAEAYTWVAPNFTSYRAIYGALAVIPLFLLWLYILWLITLFGGLLVWRFEQSFTVTDEADRSGQNISVTDRTRNHQLFGVMPYLVLLVIYDAYHKRDGLGITRNELARDLGLPQTWIVEAVEFLVAIRLVIVGTDSEQRTGLDEGEVGLFPAVPQEALDEPRALERIFAASQQWSVSWECPWSDKFRPLLSDLLSRIGKNTSAVE